MLVEESDAKKLLCPILTAGKAPGGYEIYCRGKECMFWRYKVGEMFNFGTCSSTPVLPMALG